MRQTDPVPELDLSPPRRQRWLVPVVALALSLAAAIACAAAAGESLGLYFAPITFLTILLPFLVLARTDTVSHRMFSTHKTVSDTVFYPLNTVAAAVVGMAAVWLVSGRSASCGQWLVCVLILSAWALAVAGVALMLVRVRMPPTLAAPLTVVLGLAWLTWPIWLAPILTEPVASVLVPLHPLFALNSTLQHLGLWTEHGALMYHLTTLGQHVPYALPNPTWSILFHALAGSLLMGLSHRRDAEHTEKTVRKT